MDGIGLTASDMEILGAIGAGMAGACALLAGLWAVAAHPRVRANPGDALIAVGLVLCAAAGHLARADEATLWSLLAVSCLRGLFALGHFVDERHHPTERPRSGETLEQRMERRRRRERAVAEEAVRRYEAMLDDERRRDAGAGEPIELRPRGAAQVVRDPIDEPVDAEFFEIDAHLAAPSPARPATRLTPAAPPAVGRAGNDNEILVRFDTPIDAEDLARRPDRARAAMDAIIRQLGEGARIVGIRAKRN